MDRCALIRFDGWVLHTDSGELTRDGSTTRLQDKPLRILAELLAHPGQLVTRERLIECLWPRGVVEFDMALNAAVRRLRVALRDEAETPRYIETVPRRGYRFIGALDADGPTGVEAAPPAAAAAVGSTRKPWPGRIRAYLIGGLVTLVVAGIAVISTRGAHERSTAASLLPVRPEARELYARGQKLLANMKPSDTEMAMACFGRVVTLEPTFARGYAASGMAMMQAVSDGSAGGAELARKACISFEHAQELAPDLGEAWIGRALCTQDAASAEASYRKGLSLAPGYTLGYWQFAHFLFGHGQRGEAMEVIDRALRIDPHSSPLLSMKAFHVLVRDNDLAESMRLLRASLASNPDFFPALLGLADQTWFFTGEFTDAIRIGERALQMEPDSDEARNLLAMIYLDVGDAETAAALLRESPLTVEARVSLAQYRREPVRAAGIAASAAGDASGWVHHSLSPLADAVRDSETGSASPAAAVAIIESVKAKWTATPTSYRAILAVYGHALQLANEPRRAREAAQSLLRLLDAEAVGRPANWFGRERAAAFMVLGEDERALAELAGSQRLNNFVRWWYTGELDPLYERLHRDQRFQDLVAAAARHRSEQRARLDELRVSGEIPDHRPGPPALSR